MKRIKLFEQFIYSASVNEAMDEKNIESFAKRGMFIKTGSSSAGQPDSVLSRNKKEIHSDLKEMTESYLKGIVSNQKFNADGQFKDLVDLVDDIQDNKNIKWNTSQILNLLDSIKMGYVRWSQGGGGLYPAIRVLQNIYYFDEDKTLWSEIMLSNAPWEGCKKQIGEKIKECYEAWYGQPYEKSGEMPELKGQAEKIFKGIEDGTGIPSSYKTRKTPAWNIDFLKSGPIKGHMKNPAVRLDAYKVYGQYPATMKEEQISEKIKGTQEYLGIPTNGQLDDQTWERWLKSSCAITINDIFQKYGDQDLIFKGKDAINPPADKLKKAIERIQGYAKEYFYDKMIVDGKIGSQTLTTILFLHICYQKALGRIK